MKPIINVNAKTKTWIFYLISFLFGSVLMGVEMLGSRMMAPYFGTDIFVWANIIGIVLLAVSIGNFFGGKFSNRNNILFIVTVISIILLLYIAFFYKPIFKWISNWFTAEIIEHGQPQSYSDKIIKPLSASIIVFLPLIFCLSMFTPIFIHRLSISLEDTGKVSGRVYAVSTIGNLFGTFFTSFFLIVRYDTLTTFYIFFAVFVINLIIIFIFGLDKTKYEKS